MLKIIREDISRMKADALVNCASSSPTFGPGVESALFAKGGRWLKANREKLGLIEHGHAKISKGGGSLQCKWVIHAVGPYWKDGKSGEIEALCACYREVLTLAAQAHCKTLAIPLISAGNHGFPCEVVIPAAIGEITRFLSIYKMDVTLVVYNWKAYMASGRIFGDIDNILGNDYDTEEAILKSYIDAIWPPKRRTSEQVYQAKQRQKLKEHHASYQRPVSQAEREKAVAGLRSKIKGSRKGYAAELNRLLTAKKLVTSKIYDDEYLSKQVFFKVLHGQYASAPDKDTLLMIAFRMRLTYEETSKFLAHAGLAFSPSNLRDLIIGDFISRGDYHQEGLDIVLNNEHLPQLFGTVGDERPQGKRRA